MPFIDISRQRFGSYRVLQRAADKGHEAAWTCRCDCGETREVRGSLLRAGRATNCGCQRFDNIRLNLIGERYGQLTVVADIPGSGDDRHEVLCRCVCGRETRVMVSHLRGGHTTTCGCAREAATTRLNDLNRTHGQAGSPEHIVWCAMRQRCSDPKSRSFKRYGARGIAVCGRWQTFEHFYADMGPRPTPKHTIERLNNDGAYSPDNCEWAVRHVQVRNTTRNVHISFRGRTQCLTDWAAETGIPRWTIRRRIDRGWSVERALTTPK